MGRKEIRNKRGGLHGIGVWETSWKEGVNPMVQGMGEEKRRKKRMDPMVWGWGNKRGKEGKAWIL